MTKASPGPLAGRYNLKRERLSLPAGSIWQADDASSAGHAIVFVLNEGVTDGEAVVAKTLKASQAVSDPHIVAWTDGGLLDDGRLWLAAPFVGEVTLSEHIERSSGLPATEAVGLIRQVGSAVAKVHSQQGGHGFLCGEFVRLTMASEGIFSVHVYGHGLADLLPAYSPLERDGVFGGHPEYMAPELCRGEPSQAASDLYSIGCLMYEAIRGRTPFAPRSSRSGFSTTMKRHQVENPIALHVRYGSMAHIEPYEAIALTALAKNPSARHADATELNNALDALLENAGVTAPGAPLSTTPPASDTAPEPVPESVESENTASAGTGTLMTAGLAPEVKALADAADRKRAQEAETIDLDESEEVGRPRGRRGQLKTTQMDMQSMQKPQGEVDGWFVDKPEQLSGGAHEEPANPFDDTQKSPIFWVVAGVIAALAAGSVYLAIGDPQKKNAVSADMKARANRVLTAQEEQESKRLADLKRREEARRAEEAEAEKRALERNRLAFMATGDLETVRAVAEASARTQADENMKGAAQESAAAKKEPRAEANAEEPTAAPEEDAPEAAPKEDNAKATDNAPSVAEVPGAADVKPAGADAAKSDESVAVNGDTAGAEAAKAAAAEQKAAKAAAEALAAEQAKKAKEEEAKRAAADRAIKAAEEQKAIAAAAAAEAKKSADDRAEREAKAKAKKEARAKRRAERARKQAEAEEKAKAAAAKQRERRRSAPSEDPKETSKRLTKLGVSAYKQGNFKKAASLFKRAVNFDKSNVFAKKLLDKAKGKL